MSSDDKLVKIDVETHIFLSELQNEVYRDVGEKPTYKDLVNDALRFYSEKQGWKKEARASSF